MKLAGCAIDGVVCESVSINRRMIEAEALYMCEDKTAGAVRFRVFEEPGSEEIFSLAAELTALIEAYWGQQIGEVENYTDKSEPVPQLRSILPVKSLEV